MHHFIDEFLLIKRMQGVSQRTLQGYEQTLMYFYRGMEGDEFTKGALQGWIKALMGRGVKPVTINHYIRDIRVFYYWMMEEEYIKPFKIHTLKEQEPPLKLFTEEELNKLLVKPTKYDNFPTWRTYTMICFVLATGCRANTVLNVRVEDIVDDTLVIREQKNKKTKVLPLSPTIKSLLTKYIYRYELVGWLFPNIYGEQLTYNGLRKAFSEYCHKRKVPHSNFHGLRHSFSQQCVKNGMGAFELKEWLGHSSIEVTQKYVHLFGEDLKEGLSKNPLEHLTKKKIK